MQRRILLLVMTCIALVLAGVGVISHMSIDRAIRHSLDSHMSAAGIVRGNIDRVLEENITRLHDIATLAMSASDTGMPDMGRAVLKTAYEYSIFADGVFTLDRTGWIVNSYPGGFSRDDEFEGTAPVAEAFSKKHTVVSNLITLPHSGRRVLLVLVPVKNHDNSIIGLIGGVIDPTGYLFTSAMRDVPLRNGSRIEMIDSKGTVIAGSDPERVSTHADHNGILAGLIERHEEFVGKCFRCHAEGGGSERDSDMMAFVPMRSAPWGIAVRDPLEVVYEPAISLKRAFLVISAALIAAALVLSVGLSKSIASPIGMLTAAAIRMAEGDLDTPVQIVRNDEVGVLAMSFNEMRKQLAESLESLRSYSAELEQRVAERTRELDERKTELSRLLAERMRAEEDERKRVARELHDETSQALAALGMSLEIASVALEKGSLKPAMLYELRRRSGTLVDGINRVIHDLRPPVLDDLGLEAATSWLLDKQLAPAGIRYRMDAEGFKGARLNRSVELGLFRALQESVSNIRRHSQASHVCVIMVIDAVSLLIEVADNGMGFDIDEALGSYGKGDSSLRGLGLLGMKERMGLIGAEVEIQPFPSEGTYVTITMPKAAALAPDAALGDQ